jgi:3-hydroxyisobutyrate dehydrogenase-like beta-hydroxyacid dehydrogenase
MSTSPRAVGFIGLGQMGFGMAANLRAPATDYVGLALAGRRRGAGAQRTSGAAAAGIAS